MADYSIIRKSRNTLSSFLHVLMNILLGVGSISVTLISGSWILGIILVLISKWRIFAVRPRYWLLNLKSSLVDLIVGASFVVLAYLSGTEILPIHILLAAPLHHLADFHQTEDKESLSSHPIPLCHLPRLDRCAHRHHFC